MPSGIVLVEADEEARPRVGGKRRAKVDGWLAGAGMGEAPGRVDVEAAEPSDAENGSPRVGVGVGGTSDKLTPDRGYAR